LKKIESKNSIKIILFSRVFHYLCGMKFKEGYKVREIAGEHVIIKQGRFGADMTRVIALNATSLLLWEQLQGREFEASDVVTILTENFDVDTATATTDAEAWIAKLNECDLVE
jgi:hypothetical protein